MKTIPKILLMTTALGLTVTPAIAGSGNSAHHQQSGANNAASITQSGSENRAGSTASSGNHIMTQAGDNNDLTILQSGNKNSIGADQRAADLAGNRGVDQNGDRNVAAMTQSSGGNFINVVRQDGASGATETTNSLTIVQQGSGGYDINSTGSAQIKYGNVVSVVVQNNTGSGTSAAETNIVDIFQDRTTSGGPGGFGANVVGIGGAGGNISDRGARDRGGVSQTGTGNMVDLDQLGERNAIQAVSQSGADNAATVYEDGERNFVGKITQINTGGLGNILSFNITGEDNGSQGAYYNAGAYTVGSAPASLASVIQGDAWQSGTDNQIGMIINGDDNLYGFAQDGSANRATGIDLQGDRNELAIRQSGDGNALNLASIANDDNVVGLNQVGNLNLASLTITGDRNGGYAAFGANVAGTAASVNGLTPGLMQQLGDSNDITHNISGNDNVFAFGQTGDLNTITGAQTGDFNQAAVAQNGNNNNANFAQIGNNNSIGITQ